MTNLTLLEQEILSDIENRRDLMSRIRVLSKRYAFSDEDEQLFLNYSIPIIYSVWEGFVQTSFQTYVREINKLELDLSQVSQKIMVYHLESRFPQFGQYPNDFKKKVKFFEGLNFFYTSSNILQINPSVNTEGNISWKILNKILKNFELQEIRPYQEGYSLPDELDKFLLKIRNNVAHGENSIRVHRDDLNRGIRLVNILMELVFDSIKTGFLENSYLKK